MHRWFGWHWWEWHHMMQYVEGFSPRYVFMRHEDFRMCRLCDNRPESVNIDYRPFPIDWVPEDVEVRPYF